MQIKQIAANELRYMEGKEGLILQGCGGDLSECRFWRYMVIRLCSEQAGRIFKPHRT
ncbi:hypothetical protein [Dialister invisus]|uniref:hypothetical protein n=1 Tax=Dialister invisus TaxID=218538 RepID=UPI003FD8D152